MGIGKSADTVKLEERIGYHFQNHDLLLEALTHTSYANEHVRAHMRHNERLEFLGDAVLETISSEYLYGQYPEWDEGKLTKTRASMVSETPLAKCARDLGLPGYLRLGNGEDKLGGRKKDSIISDALEALIGAVYLDGGFEEARKLVLKHVLRDLTEKDLFVDRKTALQELAQEQGQKVEYSILEEYGPDHSKSFKAAVYIDGVMAAEGFGHTKKAAEQDAADHAMNIYVS